MIHEIQKNTEDSTNGDSPKRQVMGDSCAFGNPSKLVHIPQHLPHSGEHAGSLNHGG